MGIVATTSLPAVDRPNANRWIVARSCQKFELRLGLASIYNLQVNLLSMVLSNYPIKPNDFAESSMYLTQENSQSTAFIIFIVW